MACAHLDVASFVNAKVLGLQITMHHARPVQRLGVGFRGRARAMARGGARAKFRVRVRGKVKIKDLVRVRLRGKVRVSVQCLNLAVGQEV